MVFAPRNSIEGSLGVRAVCVNIVYTKADFFLYSAKPERLFSGFQRPYASISSTTGCHSISSISPIFPVRWLFVHRTQLIGQNARWLAREVH
jgi:hypothetical protein